jgi:hypothetical protein
MVIEMVFNNEIQICIFQINLYLKKEKIFIVQYIFHQSIMLMPSLVILLEVKFLVFNGNESLFECCFEQTIKH